MGGNDMWKIVLIDDDFQTLEGMKEVIPWSELDAVCSGVALDGEEGLEVIRNTAPDLVITDIYMPNMDGLEMIEKLRVDGYEGKIIILSGYSDFEYARKALKLQVIDYLSKPISPGTLAISVNRAIEQLTEERASKEQESGLAEKVMKYEQVAVEEWLRRQLIHMNERHEEEVPAVIQSLFHQQVNILVIGIEIVRTERIQAISPLDLRLFRYGLKNIALEWMGQSGLDYNYIDLHSHTSALVIRPDRHNTALEETLQRRLRQIRDSASEYLRLSLRIGVGLQHQGWKGLSASMKEAFKAISFRQGTESDSHISFYEPCLMNGKENKVEFLAYPHFQKIAEMLRLNQREEAEAAVRQLVKELSGLPIDADIRLPQLAVEFGTIVRHALFEVSITLDSRSIGMDIDQTQEIQTLHQFHDKLFDWISYISDILSKGTNTKHKHTVDFIIQYVNEHYAEDIGTSELAEKLYMSRNHVANIFRAATGETFTSYLIRFRMEKARELIISGKYLIYEVADQVGYKNVPYFSFLFKKQTGYNPSDLLR
jgi:two-component system, response regulator YesN